MTPKEKAKQLYESFRLKFRGRIDSDDDKHDCAKECALVTADDYLNFHE